MTLFFNHDGTKVVHCDICGSRKPEGTTTYAYYGKGRPDNVWTDNSGPFFARGIDEDGRKYEEGGFSDLCPRCSG